MTVTGEPMHVVMLGLLMAVVGAMIAMSAAMWRAPTPLARYVGTAFNLSVAAYAFKLWNDETHIVPELYCTPISLLAFVAIGLFWLFVIVVFEDRRELRPTYYGAVGVLLVLSVAAHYGPEMTRAGFWVVYNLVEVAMAIHALAIIVQSWKGDLVETRRRLRGPFLIAVATYILVLRGFEIWDALGDPPAWYPMANAAVLALVSLAGSFVFLESRSELFSDTAAEDRPAPAAGATPAAPVAQANSGLDRAARADLERLEALMTRDQVWREEGLTIASLAQKAHMPETQLRRLINDRLGHRNFPSYINRHRIDAAKRRLADPNEARISISTIAFDIGFASLGPFNRAFREETGVAPSEWRRAALNQPDDDAGNASPGSPIPESA